MPNTRTLWTDQSILEYCTCDIHKHISGFSLHGNLRPLWIRFAWMMYLFCGVQNMFPPQSNIQQNHHCQLDLHLFWARRQLLLLPTSLNSLLPQLQIAAHISASTKISIIRGNNETNPNFLWPLLCWHKFKQEKYWDNFVFPFPRSLTILFIKYCHRHNGPRVLSPQLEKKNFS